MRAKRAQSSLSRGAVLAEYALLLSLIFAVSAGVIATVGVDVAGLFELP